MFVALIEPQSYLEFAATVPFKDAQGVVERGLINHEGVISGRAQAAVRPLSAADFDEIVSRGLASSSALLPRTDLTTWRSELREAQVPFQDSQLRERSLYLSSRILRDRVFRQVVLKAYDSRCAVTGLRLVNGGGRAEVDAAHIKPVEASGPDCVGNGLALSGTAHWMFDRGLISANDDLQIIISRHVNDMESIRKIINPSMRILPANRPSDRPHPHFLSWHRENCFKS
jgi:putative restriction endonuclease